MNEIQQALAEGRATVPQIAEFVKSISERLKTDKGVYAKVALDEQGIWDLLKAVKDLWQAVDELHSRHFPAKTDMYM